MSIWRLSLVAILVVGLLPTWLRTTPPPPDWRPILSFRPLEAVDPSSGKVTTEGAWQMVSPNIHFGSYSALLAASDGTFLAASDSGTFLRFAMPRDVGVEPIFGRLAGDRLTRKQLIDAEALTNDPVSGNIWIAYEGTNVIERRRADLSDPVSAAPPELKGFRSNSGPEAFVRLRDGRFIVLSEGARSWSDRVHTGVLFASDPVEGAAGKIFAFKAPDGYQPVDMAQIPDGRVLILVRRLALGIPPSFPVLLLVADPDLISGKEPWRGQILASIAAPMPSDNFEGLAVVPKEDGSLTLWLISDDNGAALQRTLLLKLRWDPAHPPRIKKARIEKARENSARLSKTSN